MRPYAEAAPLLKLAGWQGILPLPPRAKHDPPKKFSGSASPDPTDDEIAGWIETQPDGNVALRLPTDVIGIDVDNYGEKPGGETLAEAEQRLGKLPATWRVTSRDDGVSGIRLFRVEPGYAWKGKVGAGIEICQRRHRYVVVAPSIHPDTGRPYRYINPAGVESIAPPNYAELPSLPATWQVEFRRGPDDPKRSTGADVTEWLGERGQGSPCDAMIRATEQAITALDSGESHHDVAMSGSMKLVGLASEGHSGAIAALEALEQRFYETADRPDAATAEGEWARLVEGAVDQMPAEQPGDDPCLYDFGNWKQQPKAEPPPKVEPVPEPKPSKARAVTLKRASQFTPMPVHWLWDDRIPLGMLTLLPGREGTGKSQFCAWLAARVTRGELQGQYDTPKSVIYMATEDSWEHTIVPRLIAAGADLDKVYCLNVEEEEVSNLTLSLPRDNEDLKDAIRQVDAAVCVFDPLMSAIDAMLDTHKNRDVRAALEPLAAIGDETKCTMLGIAHFNKSSGNDMSNAISGSGAFKDVARAIIGFAKKYTEEGELLRVMTQTKNSVGRDDLPSYEYDIEEVWITEEIRTSRFVLKGESEFTAEDLRKEGELKTGVEDWLREELEAQESKTMLAKDVITRGKSAGWSENQLRRKIKSIGHSWPAPGRSAGWVWGLVTKEHHEAWQAEQNEHLVNPTP